MRIKELQIKQIAEAIKSADKIVIGAGAGLSAAAGLNYADPEIFRELYTPFLKKGYKTIWDGITDNWSLNRENATTYWGFWANHINNIYYSQEQLEAYRLLYDIIRDRQHFIITTNGDGQFFKGNFDTAKIFAMQGSYGNFQTQHGSDGKVYDNRKMIEKMLEGFDPQTLTIREEDVPILDYTGELFCPNLRIDQYFVEKPYMLNKDAYVDFVTADQEKILFLELGVGYNTPVIIRYPFEQMTYAYENATLVRVNTTAPQVSPEIKDKAISTDMDIKTLLEELQNYL